MWVAQLNPHIYSRQVGVSVGGAGEDELTASTPTSNIMLSSREGLAR